MLVCYPCSALIISFPSIQSMLNIHQWKELETIKTNYRGKSRLTDQSMLILMMMIPLPAVLWHPHTSFRKLTPALAASTMLPASTNHIPALVRLINHHWAPTNGGLRFMETNYSQVKHSKRTKFSFYNKILLSVVTIDCSNL